MNKITVVFDNIPSELIRILSNGIDANNRKFPDETNPMELREEYHIDCAECFKYSKSSMVTAITGGIIMDQAQRQFLGMSRDQIVSKIKEIYKNEQNNNRDH